MTRLRAWLHQRSLTDSIVVGATVLLLILVTVSSTAEDTEDGARPFDGWALLLVVAAALSLLVHRRWPGLSALPVISLSSIYYGVDYGNGLINVPIMVACYQLGTTGDRRRQLAVGAFILGLPAVSIGLFSDVPLSEGTDAVGWPLVGILFGQIVRARRDLLEQYAERADIAEAERDAEAERRVAEERLRIARDVHDVLAHTVSVMTVQAGLAADALDRDPETARRSLATIRSAGKQAMGEVRATISVLRNGDAPAVAAQTAPAPGLDRVPELVEVARAQGLEVELTIERAGDAHGVDAEGVELDSLVELTAYRVVQEALTNVSRHGNASRAEVRISHQPSELVIDVRDNGTAALPAVVDAATTAGAGPAAGAKAAAGTKPAAGTGFGLKGMQERIEPLGGRLRSGPEPDGGWRVHATLPLRRTGP